MYKTQQRSNWYHYFLNSLVLPLQQDYLKNNESSQTSGFVGRQTSTDEL